MDDRDKLNFISKSLENKRKMLHESGCTFYKVESGTLKWLIIQAEERQELNAQLQIEVNRAEIVRKETSKLISENDRLKNTLNAIGNLSAGVSKFVEKVTDDDYKEEK